jgi:hypothetical protein
MQVVASAREHAARGLPPHDYSARRTGPAPFAAARAALISAGASAMSVPFSEQYKGFAIGVQALRRAKEPDQSDDAPRRFDIVVTISRKASGERSKAEMFGVPEHAPLDDQIEAHRIGVQYARDIIDGKVDGSSVTHL